MQEPSGSKQMSSYSSSLKGKGVSPCSVEVKRMEKSAIVHRLRELLLAVLLFLCLLVAIHLSIGPGDSAVNRTGVVRVTPHFDSDN